MQVDPHSLAGWIGEKLDSLFGGIHKRWDTHVARLHSETVYLRATGTTDGSGNLDLPIGQIVPTGKRLLLERWIQWEDGQTPASVSTTGWSGIFHGPGKNPATLADFVPEKTGEQVFPRSLSYSHAEAPRFKSGEQMHLGCTGCDASTKVHVFAQGCLETVGYRS